MDAALLRLEAVTTRLEALEGRAPTVPPNKDSFTPPKFSVALPGLATPGKQPVSRTDTQGDVLAHWDGEVQPALADFMSTAEELGAGVLPASQIVRDAFEAERTVIDAIGQCQKPDQNGLGTLVAPISAQMQSANTLAEDRRSSTFNHHKVIAEALQSLSWVIYSGPSSGMSLPAQHIEEAWQSAEFYANKILVEFRNKAPKHTVWVKQLKELLMKMRAHVQTHHKTGPAWKAQGLPISKFSPQAQAAGAQRPAAAAQALAAPQPKRPQGGGPPPPPPPAAGSMNKERGNKSQAPAGPGFSAVLSAINTKGDGVTSGLRKVTADMKSKNRSDRTGVVPASAAAAATSNTSKPAPAAPGKQKARTECEQGRKWVVEHHEGQQSIIIDETTPKQTVYIYKCSNSTVQIKGKVNAITIDQCHKTGVVFDSLVASCELVNSSSLQVQVTGVVPTLAVDKCDGVQLFLSEASLGTSVTTAKSSAINVLIPGKEGEDMTELYVPEQFISTVKDGTLVTEAVAHSG